MSTRAKISNCGSQFSRSVLARGSDWNWKETCFTRISIHACWAYVGPRTKWKDTTYWDRKHENQQLLAAARNGVYTPTKKNAQCTRESDTNDGLKKCLWMCTQYCEKGVYIDCPLWRAMNTGMVVEKLTNVQRGNCVVVENNSHWSHIVTNKWRTAFCTLNGR